MGLFSKVFGKETCVLCGNECGALHRDKVKGGEYVCSECKRKCSKYVRLSEMDQAGVEEHIRYMEWQEKLYSQLFEKATRETFPTGVREMGISFADELGMFAIVERSDPANKICHELFRYDQVDSYERYEEMVDDNGQKKVGEIGIKLKLISPLEANRLSLDQERKGLRAHPYITREIKVVFQKGESSSADYSVNAVAHFDAIFGVHDDETALFSMGGGSTQQKRKQKAGRDLSNLIGGAVNAVMSGADEPDKKLQNRFEEFQSSAAEANTGGMSVYSKRADDAEHQIPK